MKRSRPNKRGFTLVEIMVVIAIIVVAGSFLVPNLVKQLGRAKKDLAKPRMATIEDAIHRYYLHTGSYPEGDGAEALQVLLTNSNNIEGWDGPYLKASQLIDPWGRPYIYKAEGDHNPGSFDLISYGADGQEGGDKENEDIYND